MPRSLNAVTKAAILAQQTSESFWYLLELSHTSLPTPLRFCTNNETISRLGEDWLPSAFDVRLPSESEDQIPRVSLSIENIDRTLVDALRSLDGPLSVALYVATSADVALIVGPFLLIWREAQYDARTIEASLEAEDVLNTRYLRDEFVPSKFAGLFR